VQITWNARLAAIGSILVVVSGCATVGTTSPQEARNALAATAVESKALVYFMAPQIGGFIVNISMNGRNVGKVKDRTFIYCYFAPGSYDVVTDGQFPIMGKWSATMSIDQNKTYYIMVPYGPARFVQPESARRTLNEYYSLSKIMDCKTEMLAAPPRR
jgi:hypothetical protein